MNRAKYILLLLLVNLSLFSCKSSLPSTTEISFEQKLKNLFPTAEISAIKVNDHFTESYRLILKQPLDHNNPDAGTFDHYVYVSHSDYSQPTVLVTEGYSAKHRTYELSTLLKANQVMVEYRFYGKSRPNPIPWKYLTNDQAIQDYHLLVMKLKKIYTNKWISTGISKGGETVLIYKSQYPKDMDAAVSYVAPLINTREDPRTQQHIATVGTEECRTKITNFQRLLLTRREALLKEIDQHSRKKKMSFTKVSSEEALEYAVLEFPFSFWQWGGKCDEIPNGHADAATLFAYLNKVVGIGFYNDKTYHDLLPSYYQHMIELGYYGFDTTPVQDLVKVVKQPTNMRFAPKNIPMIYDQNYIKKVRDYVENEGDHVIYIYGEYDPWGACSPNPKPHVNALKMVLPKGSHSTRIKNFSKEDQRKIYDKLQTWLSKDD
ncbi:S28 family serine protease [Aquimarina sp. Aq78]|uniref:S28 family serine protease n=1 Tax=Aquimarina sp. Aq78 TaxID=1191889 RepID=UPI000D0FD9EE|nr:S28 family serine protease [Aquimarina sp. Aq78]